MDTKLSNTVVLVRDAGKLPSDDVTFYDGAKNKPKLVVHAALRASYLSFKTNKEKGTKRESMAVVVPKIDTDDFSGVKGNEMLNAMLEAHQDSILARVADGEIDFRCAHDADWIVKDFFDTSRDSNGRKVTKESIAEWFMANVAEHVIARALVKNGQATEETLQNIAKGFCTMFQKFTGYALENVFTPVQVKLLRELLTVTSTKVDSEDEMLAWIDAKLVKLEAAKVSQDGLADLI